VVSFAVCIFTLPGKLICTFQIEDMGKGIAVTKDEIFISLDDQNKIVVYSHQGEKLREWGSKGAEKAQFDRPYQLALSSDNDRLFVCDSWNNRIQVFDRFGNFLYQFGKNGDRDGEFRLPRGIFVDKNFIIIADSGNNRVQVFHLDGSFITKIGTYPEFFSPHGVALHPQNNTLYIADTGNHGIKLRSANTISNLNLKNLDSSSSSTTSVTDNRGFFNHIS